MSKRKDAYNVLWTDEKLRTSKAFRSLRAKSIIVLMDFYSKKRVPKKIGFYNNGELIYTYDEAAAMGIHKAAFSRALSELVEKGFIDITQYGTGLHGSVSKYALSVRWIRYGTASFKSGERRNPHKRHKFRDGHEKYQ